jgi:predicted anti-sigma-YlaC factor YlaD
MKHPIMTEVDEEKSKKMDPRLKGVLLVIGAYVVTIGIVICIISFAIMSLSETHSCSVMTRALATLLITMAVVFLISIAVVGVVARKVFPNRIGCLATVGVYGLAMLASFIFFAFGLMVAFNC